MNSNAEDDKEPELVLARTVRAACVQAAKKAFEDASINGLCDEGAWEAAIGAIEMMDIRALISQAPKK